MSYKYVFQVSIPLARELYGMKNMWAVILGEVFVFSENGPDACYCIRIFSDEMNVRRGRPVSKFKGITMIEY